MRFISVNHYETPIPRVSPLYSHLSHPTLGIYRGRYVLPDTHYRRLRRLISHSLEHTLDYIPVPYYDLLTNPCWEKWVQTSPWNSMDLHLPTHGIPRNLIFWRFVIFHGYPCPYCWNSMELQLLMIREIPWNSRQGKLEIHGIPGLGILWKSMDSHMDRLEFHGYSAQLCGIPWISRVHSSHL